MDTTPKTPAAPQAEQLGLRVGCDPDGSVWIYIDGDMEGNILGAAIRVPTKYEEAALLLGDRLAISAPQSATQVAVPDDKAKTQGAVLYSRDAEMEGQFGTHPALAAPAAAPPAQEVEPLSEREAFEKALEFAEYMATAADHFLTSVEFEDVKRAAWESVDKPHKPLAWDQFHDAQTGRCEFATTLRRRIYEFRKRSEKAVRCRTAPAAPSSTADGSAGSGSE